MTSGRKILRVGPVSQTDARLMTDLAVRTFRESVSAGLTRAQIDAHVAEFFSLERQSRDLTDPRHRVLVASDHGVLCGYALIRLDSHSRLLNHPYSVELSRLYVLTDWMGQGIGSQLMRNALHAVRLHGGQECWLQVGLQNLRAIEFFHRWGFTAVGLSSQLIGAIEIPSLVMARSLP